MVAEVGATTHASVYHGNKCLDDTITAYLLNGTLPTRVAGDNADVTCERGPLPQPSILNRGLPVGQLGYFIGAPEELAAILNQIPV